MRAMGDISSPIEPEHFNFAHTKENQIRWLGLHGLRRSAASLLWSLTGDTQASQLLPRHSSPQTTTKHSLTFDRSKITSGLKKNVKDCICTLNLGTLQIVDINRRLHQEPGCW
jgi:hypothetical protein